MSGIALSFSRSRLASVVFGMYFLIAGIVQAQTVDITSHADNEVITIFTEFGVVPPSKFITVEADTTGSIGDVYFGLGGFISGNNWSSGTTSSLGVQDSVDTSLYATSLDLATASLVPNGSTGLTLRAFAYALGSSGYTSTGSVANFDANDSVPVTLTILPSADTDADSNGIPDADEITNTTSSSGDVHDFLFQPDPVNQPDYWVERRTVSIEDGGSPTGFTFHYKQFVIDFQLYNVTIAIPNMSWFKTNRAGVPAVDSALNMVLHIRAEQDPNFILDNHSTHTRADPLFDAAAYGSVDPPVEFATQYGSGVDVPIIYFDITVLLETSVGVWEELPLSATAPMSVLVDSAGMEDTTDLHVYRYPTTTVQSATDTNNIFMMGNGDPWSEVTGVSPLLSNGFTSSFSFTELAQGVMYAASVKVPATGGRRRGGGGGGGGCFIATAVYGTPMAQEVDALRSLRDGYLLNTPLGAAFVDGYYRLSPVAADVIAESAALRAVVRAVLTPVVWMTQILLVSPRLLLGLVLLTVVLGLVNRRSRETS